MTDISKLAARLTADVDLESSALVLDFGGYRIAVRSNSRMLLERLSHYFAHLLSSGRADVEVFALHGPLLDLGVDFRDWKREPRKPTRKDAYCDLPDGRVVLKLRTGMIFLQSSARRIAYGPCLDNESQVINFINSQYMNWLLQRGALICHASGAVIEGAGLAIGGDSGRGKSTLMLHLLEQHEAAFLTNDRLLVQTTSEGEVRAVGIPKMPRVNPGTLMTIPTLRGLLTADRWHTLSALSTDELWHLEEKHDVDVRTLYGESRLKPQAPLRAVLILNWQRDSSAACTLQEVTSGQRGPLLEALRKSPGPCYQFADGTFYQDHMQPDISLYQAALKGVTVWEARGQVDFHAAAQHCRDLMRAMPWSESC